MCLTEFTQLHLSCKELGHQDISSRTYFFELFQVTYPLKTQCGKLGLIGGKKKITWEIFILKGQLVKTVPKYIVFYETI